jgi:hypothetical protein
MKQTHTLGQVTYGSAGRRWTFQSTEYTYATNRMPGGRPTADKIAAIINGGASRTKGHGIDNLARANMNKVFHTAARAQVKIIPHVGFTSGKLVTHSA